MNPGDEIGRDDEATSGAGGGGGGAARPPAAHVLIDEARSARWFVYRRQSSPLDPAVEWSDWGDVRDGARGANPQLAGLLEKNHARAVTAILDRTDWTGRGAHHCGTLAHPQPGTYVLVYAVYADADTVYYASPVALPWMTESPAAAR